MVRIFINQSRFFILLFFYFFFNDTATTEIYTLSLHDALPISFLTVSSLLYSERPDAPPKDIVFTPVMQSSPTSARYWTPDVEIVEARLDRPNGSVESADIRKSLLKIRMTNQPHCNEPTREREVVIFEGWIAAYQPDGNASVWFHSRGC